MGPGAMGRTLILLFFSCALRLGHPPATAAHKASLWMTPAGGIVPVGQQVSLRCLCQVPCTRLFLYRGTGPIPVRHVEAQGLGAEFPISHSGPGDAGSYHCRYLSRSGLPRWSESSDPIHLVVGGVNLGSSSPTAPPEFPSLDSSLTAPPEPPSPASPALLEHRSIPSSAAPAPTMLLDFTHSNILRLGLGLGAGVLLALGLILAKSCYSWERQSPRPSERPEAERGPPTRASGALVPGVPCRGGCTSLLTRCPMQTPMDYKPRRSGKTGNRAKNWQLPFSGVKGKAAPVGHQKLDCAHETMGAKLAGTAPESSWIHCGLEELGAEGLELMIGGARPDSHHTVPVAIAQRDMFLLSPIGSSSSGAPATSGASWCSRVMTGAVEPRETRVL